MPSNDVKVAVHKEAVPDTPVSPNPLRNGLLTLVVGLAIIGVAAIVRGLRRKEA
jgi:capsular polysaccharide biosynthesis protein